MCSGSYFPVCTTVSLSVLMLVFQVLFLTSFVVGFSFCSLLFYPCWFLLSAPREELLIFIGAWFSPWSSLFRIILAWIVLLCEMRDYLAVTLYKMMISHLSELCVVSELFVSFMMQLSVYEYSCSGSTKIIVSCS